ncbi:class I adenylate-forming enzyme family protein [Patulibacter minatonensis]|uniref:class I adenylate-forming enzyme family protein n=1 Tax=Patulibacter minatonensis TaxID=298163 RepID=UPI0006852925|nr:AMP-binding protein [Patulibacter minatonensis]
MSSVESWLLRSARRRPEHEALLDVTYAELLRDTDLLARRLWAAGARPDAEVGVLLPPGRPFVTVLHALLRIGAVVVPLDPRLPVAEVDRRLSRAVLRLDAAAVDGLPGPDAAADLRDEHDLDAVAIVVHTSGTSGPAKPIPLTYGNWLWSALGSAATLGCPPGERWLCALPLNHVGGLSVLLRSAIAGTTAVVHGGWDTERVLASLSGRLPEEGPPPTVVSVVPTTLRRLLDAGLHRTDRMALRWVLLGGASIPGGMLEEAAEAGIPVAPTYGMSETTSQIATLGAPLFCTRVAITAADGTPTTAPGVTGEVLVSGPTVSRAAVADDGLLHTGDLGVLDERGHLRIVGRSSDTIITGGENVLPLEVERVLETDPSVTEAAVFGRPDREWGERVCARVVPAPGREVDVAALRAAAGAQLLRHQVPREIEVVDDLPRTPSGKLLRRQLT